MRRSNVAQCQCVGLAIPLSQLFFKRYFVFFFFSNTPNKCSLTVQSLFKSVKSQVSRFLILLTGFHLVSCHADLFISLEDGVFLHGLSSGFGCCCQLSSLELHPVRSCSSLDASLAFLRLSLGSSSVFFGSS